MPPLYPKEIRELISSNALSYAELQQFYAWLPTYQGPLQHIEINKQIFFPYEVYQAWYISNQNMDLLSTWSRTAKATGGTAIVS